MISTLRDAAVRDLAWVISSPGLLDSAYPAYRQQLIDDHWCNTQLQAGSHWLSALDLQPQALPAYIAARPTRRLGHYFETLIAYWLQHMPDTQLIASNLQVQSELRTLGEYDFLLRNAAGEICHWEAAVKFYLQAEDIAEQRAFIGPGTQDRLDLKMQRVFQHQLQLGHSLQGQQALPPGLTLNRAQAFIKGYLFYHATQPRNTAPIPGVSNAHLSGWWYRYGKEPLPQSARDKRWIILPRLRWLSPACLPADSEVLTQEALEIALQRHFTQHNEALLLCEMQRVENTWQECKRGFVVCAEWPKLGNALVML